MNIKSDNRIVLTLDAGGTNFVFSALQGGREIISPLRFASNAHDLDLCLDTIINGFKSLQSSIADKATAISFAFPGPADYPNGIIGELGNLPAFKGDVPLGAMLQEIFDLPVFINNDGDLFAYGEYMAGLMPWVNNEIKQAGSPKQYSNLLGITLGTGFGAGIVRNGELFAGDNSNAGEIWLLRNHRHHKCFAEEGISIRAIVNYYRDNAKTTIPENITPKDIFDIATGKLKGDKSAGLGAFAEMAMILADALANAVTLIDGLVVIGGGLSASFELWGNIMLNEMNGTIETYKGEKIARLRQKVYNLEDDGQLTKFLSGNKKEVKVPRSGKPVIYDPEKRIGIGLSRLGTSEAIHLGAYAFALNELDKRK